MTSSRNKKVKQSFFVLKSA